MVKQAGLFKRLKSITIQNFAPYIAVVTSGISTDDVIEIGASVPGDDLRDQADLTEIVFFELVDIQVLRFCECVVFHIQQRRSQVFNRDESLVEQTALHDLIDQTVGNGLACLVMLGLRSRFSEYCRNGIILGLWVVKTHLPSNPASLAASAAPLPFGSLDYKNNCLS